MEKKHAFTLVELLVVIGIIAILAAILLPVLGAASGRAEAAKAKSGITNLKNAIAAYQMEYGKLPKPKGYADGKAADADPKALTKDEYKWLIQVLQGDEPTDKTAYGNPNTRKKTFLETQGNTKGEYKDPWGSDYNVVFEFKFEKGINNAEFVIPGLYAEKDSSDKRWVHTDLVIWSDGADGISITGKNEDDYTHKANQDNIYSLDTVWGKDGHAITR